MYLDDAIPESDEHSRAFTKFQLPEQGRRARIAISCARQMKEKTGRLSVQR